MRKFSVILGLILVACSVGNDPQEPQYFSDTTSQDSNHLWQEKLLLDMPLKIRLPQSAFIERAETYQKGVKLIGNNVFSSQQLTDAESKNNYFFFSIYLADGFVTAAQYKEKMCMGNANSFEEREEDQWEQGDIKITQFNGCTPFSVGYLLEYEDQVYVISLPGGDWGPEGHKYFDQALRSITI